MYRDTNLVFVLTILEAIEKITQHLEDLKEAVLEILKKIDYDEGLLQAALNSEYYQHLHYLKNK